VRDAQRVSQSFMEKRRGRREIEDRMVEINDSERKKRKTNSKK